MIEFLREQALKASEYIVLTGLVVTGGIFAIAEWRRNPYLPIAGAFMGPVGGLLGAAMTDGQFWAVLLTFLGTLMGPSIAITLQDPKLVRRLAEHALDRLDKTSGGSRDKLKKLEDEKDNETKS